MVDKQSLAEDRTDWAKERNALTLQRILLSRLRLGLAFMGVALGFAATSHTFGARLIGDIGAATSLVISGAIIVLVLRKASTLSDRFDKGSAEFVKILSASLLFGVVLIGYFIFTLRH